MSSKLFFKAVSSLCLWLSEHLAAPIDSRLLVISRWAIDRAGLPSSTTNHDAGSGR